MEWEPISLTELLNEISNGVKQMDEQQKAFWEHIKITPQKWLLSPWGDMSGGFYVVGILGHKVIWFNDIEDGFNTSMYTEYGKIDNYHCNQDELQWQIGFILNGNGFTLGPPEKVPPNKTMQAGLPRRGE